MQQRKADILKLLYDNGSVSVEQLSQLFRVSPATVRRDLTNLEENKLIRRSYGKAWLVDKDVLENSFLSRQNEHLEAKQMIARNVMQYLDDYTSFYIDGSTTCTEVAKIFPNSSKYTVFTNSNEAFKVLQELDRVSLFVIGGVYSCDKGIFDGDQALSMAKELFVDVAMVSCSGYSKDGFVNKGLSGSMIRRTMLQNSQCRLLLADSSKYNVRGVSSLGTWDDVDMLFTDKPMSDEDMDYLKLKNVKVIY